MTSPHALLPSAEAIQADLSTRIIGKKLFMHAEVDSTNDVAAALAKSGTPDGTVVVAERQTRGHGRLGRRWVSPPGVNLYFSIVIRRDYPLHLLTWLPLLAALGVARSVEKITGLAARLKWPNDVICRRGDRTRKVAGILAESIGMASSTERAIVVGIGLNANATAEAFLPDLQSIASSLLMETGRPVDRVHLLVSILSEIETLYDELRSRPALTQAGYYAACDTIGKEVRVELLGNQHVEGVAEAVGPEGALRVRVADGALVDIFAGDVVHLR